MSINSGVLGQQNRYFIKFGDTVRKWYRLPSDSEVQAITLDYPVFYNIGWPRRALNFLVRVHYYFEAAIRGGEGQSFFCYHIIMQIFSGSTTTLNTSIYHV